MVLTELEEYLLEVGYDQMDLRSRNRLMTSISNKGGIDLVDITPADVLEHHKKLKIDVFEDKVQEEICKGFTASNGHTYRSIVDDQVNFVGKACHLLLNPEIETVDWKTEDAGYVSHTRSEWLSVYNEGVVHKEQLAYRLETLRGMVRAATSHEELTQITWDMDLEDETQTQTQS